MLYSVLLFDAIIALVVAGVPLYLLWLSAGRIAPHRKGRLAALGVLLVVLWAVVVYGSFIEPRRLLVKHYEVTVGDRGKMVTAAVISDFHLGAYKHEDWVRQVVERTNAEKPDVVILAGDLVSTKAGLAAFGPIADLKAPLGVYAVLGNWDYQVGAVDVRNAIEARGAEVLTNEAVPLGSADERLWLVGLDDFRYGKPDWTAAMKDVPADATAILAVHNPDLAPAAELHGIPLVIAGHTHCGQIRLPLLGPVPRLPTSLGQRFDCGLFTLGPTHLFITPGVGESGPRSRFFVPPEISLLKIRY